MKNYYVEKTSVDFNKAQDYLDLCNSASKIFKKEPNIIKTESCENYYEVLESYHAPSNCKAILYRKEGDIVSKAGHAVGEDFVVPVNLKNGKNPKWGPFGTAEWHRIENMGDCRNSQPASVYEQNNPEWKNKYIKGELKSYEIEDIPKEVYALFDDAVNDRLKHGAVINAQRPFGYNIHGTKCAGTYQVNGYTRGDGVQVSSYYRTCGAAHNA